MANFQAVKQFGAKLGGGIGLLGKTLARIPGAMFSTPGLTSNDKARAKLQRGMAGQRK